MQMSKGLRSEGWDITLLRCRHPEDAHLLPIIQSFPGRVVTAPFFGRFSGLLNRKGLRRVLRLCWQISGDPEQKDYPELTAARFVKFAKASPIPKPNLVLAITAGQLEGFASGLELSHMYECPLILEFRDPVPHPGHAPLRPSHHELLKTCLSESHLDITTTHGIRRALETGVPCTKGKVKTIYSCYDDEVAPASGQPLKDDRLTLVHAGVLYGGEGRNARSLVKAIATAVRIEPKVHGRILLRLIGAGKGGEEAMDLANALDIPWAVELVAQMSHSSCMAQMDRAHVLVVIKFDNPEFDLQIPGKTFQYLGRGKPILGIMRETEAAEILRRSRIGTVLDHSNVDGISATLLDFWKNRTALHSVFKPDWDYIRQFSLSEMRNSFDREFAAVVSQRTESRRAVLSRR
jgi:hypothetical protein